MAKNVTAMSAMKVGSVSATRRRKNFSMSRVLDVRRKAAVPSGRLGGVRLRELFGLTAAEARFAQLIASGDSVEEVAEKMGIKLTTARSKLAVIFSKTETRRQTKLVALLSRIAHLG